MQRDMDLVRKVLLALEAKPVPEAVDTVQVDGYDDLVVRYHLLLLAQAKLIDYEPEFTKTGRIIRVLAFNPSWQGYEFLDAARNDTVWSKAKQMVKEKGGSVPFEVLQSILMKVVASLFNVG